MEKNFRKYYSNKFTLGMQENSLLISSLHKDTAKKRIYNFVLSLEINPTELVPFGTSS